MKPALTPRPPLSGIRPIFFILFSLLVLIGSSSAQEYRDIVAGSRPEFPGDLFFRDEFRIQWWYFTGHLTDAEGKEFGYEVTFFVAGVQKRKYRSRFGVNDLYISHFALSDISGKKYYHADAADSGAYGFAGAEAGRLRVWVNRNMLEGDIGKMHVTADDKAFSLDLVLTPTKPLVLHGDSGYSRKSAGSPLFSSLYFSSTRMETGGRLRIQGRTLPVKGISWFDRELSSRGLAPDLKGWDWFSLQLDDGREIMLYIMRRLDGSPDPASSGTIVGRDGRYRRLSLGDFSITVQDHYTSAKTKARYPSRWKVSIPTEGLELNVSPLLQDQEFVGMNSTGNYYWEGTCSVTGTAAGRAYVELTGY